MKYLFLVIMVSFCLSCQQKNKSDPKDIKASNFTENFDWLLGNWKRSNDTEPTVFELTEIEQETFTCENEENEFPKKIKYSKSGKKLMAIISGEDMKIPFEFEPISMN